MQKPKNSGSKYLRKIEKDGAKVSIDVYDVLIAFGVTCPARAHAVKKLLCAGLREKGSCLQDLKETVDAVKRAVEIQESFETGDN